MRDWVAFVRSRLSLSDLAPDREARIVRELAAQLEDFCRDALSRGATAEEADAHACGQIADWERLARDLRQADRPHQPGPMDRLVTAVEGRAPARGGALRMFANILMDARYSIRQMLKTPGFTLVTVLTLGFGIGATSAVFSVVNGIVLRPLPYREAERLVRIFEILPQYGRFAVAPANFLDWRSQNTVFERIATYTGGTDTFIGTEGPERISRAMVSWDIFELLGVSPLLGRGFRPEEDLPQRNTVVVLSYGTWQRRFGGSPDVLGRTITLSGTPVTIVGVMPAGFYFPNRAAELWRPIALNAADATRGGHFLAVIARVKPGISVQQAGAEMKAIAERLASQYPQNSRDESAETTLLQELIVGPVRPMLATLLAAVAFVILIACANVANLLLVRASAREREIAIRTALGAGRRRIALQMLSESLVLALAGGSLGVLLAYLAIGPIQTLGAGSLPRVADITVDWTVLAFALAVTLSTGILFGFAPAWQAARGGAMALKEGRASTGGGHRLRAMLLVAEVALSIVLLVGAALLLRSFAKLTSVDPGFRPERVLSFDVALPQTAYRERHDRAAFFDRLLQALRGTPGVEAAGMVQVVPIRNDYMLSFTIQGRPPGKPGQDPSANYRVISPGYFETIGVPLIRGRLFSDHDSDRSPMVAVVDEAFARQHFPDEDPIGRGIDIGNGTDGFYQIVGIVGSVHHEGLNEPPRPTMYVPYEQEPFSSMSVMVRTRGNPADASGLVRQALREIDPTLPAFAMAPLATVITESVAQRRFSMLLLALFAGVALFLAAVGLYGVVAYAVSQRTREIGLRMAIGAEPGDVLWMVMSSGMKLTCVGLAAGVAMALALTRLIASMLFDVTPLDVTSFGTAAAALLAVAAVACYVPARRAMGVDPLVALRQE